MIPFDLLVIAVGTVVVLSVPAYRNRRSVAFLAVLGGLLLVANLAPNAEMELAIKAVAIGGYLLGLIWFPRWLARISRREMAYDERLRAILGDARRAHADWTRARARGDPDAIAAARSAAIDVYVRALEAIDALDPPGPAWEETTQQLRAYVAAADARARLPGPGAPMSGPLTDAALAAQVAELDRSWNRAIGLTH